jgi:hypothetical protein
MNCVRCRAGNVIRPSVLLFVVSIGKPMKHALPRATASLILVLSAVLACFCRSRPEQASARRSGNQSHTLILATVPSSSARGGLGPIQRCPIPGRFRSRLTAQDRVE